jgi:integrase
MGDGTWRDPALAKVQLAEYTTWWLENRPELRPRTRELYGGLLRLHIEPYLGECRFGSLTTAEVRAWHADMLRRGTPGPVTVAKAYRLLRCILNDAVEDGLLVRNPCTIRGAGVERSPERPIATIAQVYQLSDAIEGRYRLMVLLGTFCGLRLGELLALRRDRIDVLHRRVIVSEQGQELADGTRLYSPPKTAAGVRTVAIPPHLLVDVEDHLMRWVAPEPSGLMFTGPKAHELYRATFNAAWDRARRVVGMEGFHFHDLRHTGNTLAAGTGASTKELMARMGHASARAALVYQHASEERDVRIAEQLSVMTEEALKRSGDPRNDSAPRDRSLHVEQNG